MKSTHLRPLFATALFLGLLTPAVAQGNLQMGKMWTFENPPLAYLEEEYGFAPTEEWMNSLRLASLRFGGGCSASFVSPKGLIMTNHHCVRDNVAQVQGANDWVANGFYATSMEEEIRVPGLTVQQLESMEDITARMNAEVPTAGDAAAIAEKKEANRTAILEQAGRDHPGLQAEVVSLFQGAVYQLYLYKIYDDIRLVCTPHLQTSHFGGDPDNFTYPRFGLDFSFCRAYEDGEPADTSGHYFRWSVEGPQEGELVFVPGNPGSTSRLQTVAELEAMRDTEYPIALGLIQGQLNLIKRIMAEDPVLEKQFRTAMLQLENSDKAYTGYLGGLLDEDLMAEKARAEEAFRELIEADPDLNSKYGHLWDELADLAAQKNELEPLIAFHTPLVPSGPLAKAEAIVRAVDPGSADQERQMSQMMAMQIGVAMNPIQEGVFFDHLVRAAEWLEEDDPFIQSVMGGLEPADALARLKSSRIGEAAFANELMQGGMAAVESSDDPAVVAARVLIPLMRRHRAAAEELDAKQSVLGTLMGQALHAVYGNKVSPDATFTLRFSDGIVKGYPYNGTIAPHRTSFYGLYGRSAEFDNQYPFNLPPIWTERKDRIDMNKGVNFVSTNDLIGGNSGSPVVNQQLEVVGLVFDGNIEMLPNNFLYRDDVPRSVAVHVHGIMEALQKIYDAGRVADELVGK